MDQATIKPATIFLLDLDSEDEAGKLAQKLADQTGREIEIRNADGELIAAAAPTKH